MRLCSFFSLLFASILFSGTGYGECLKGQDHRTNQSGGVQVVDFTVTGTQSLTSGQVTALTGNMIGGCYDDDSDELQERVRALFQDEGYFYAEVKSFHVVPVDPLKTPKLVKLEAEVNEGQQVRVNEIDFTGNHHFSSDKLRASFSLKAGDVFDRSLIAGGLQGVRKIYVADGFLDMIMIPDTKNVGSGMNLTVEVREGPQYHMDQLDVFAKKEVADRVRAAWELRQGEVYDPGYLDKFLDGHQAILPEGFGRSNVQIVRDCPDATVNVRFIIDAVEAAAHPAKPVECEKSQDSNP